jgi:amino acid adenylation domain-containing protein
LREVMARHDILRTAVVWEGLREPAQVVWREAELPVEEVALDQAEGEAAEQLLRRFDPRRMRLDLRQAPLMRCVVAQDAANDRWLLLWLSHHLTTDHVTLEMTIREAQACLLGEGDRLPAPQPFRNYVAQTRLGVSRQEHERFFREMLGDMEEPTAPFGLLEAQGDGSGIEEARLELEEGLARRLRERSRALRVSAASLCHLAWAIALGRVSGREDVVFGTVLFGRMQGGAGADQALGLFINTLPIRLRVGAEGVERGVRHTHRLLTELLRHEHASLALAQRCSGVEAPTPLFSSLLNYRHSLREAEPSPGAAQAWAGIKVLESAERTNYPLLLLVDDFGDGFSLTAQAVKPIEPGRICEYMLTALEGLVEALEREPEKEARAIEVASEAERRQILEEWNRTTRWIPQATLTDLFEGQAAKQPHAVAVIHEDLSLTYGKLNARANRLAHCLRQLGVGPETRVALCLERSIEMMIAILATLKAGGAYVPLDPAYPPERLAYMLEDSAPTVLLTHDAAREALGSYSPPIPVLNLDRDAALWSDRSTANPARAETDSDRRGLAYIIYTSGSTGAPKGVMVEHANLVRLLHATDEWFGFGPADTWTLFHSYAFDFSVWEIWGALAYGGRLVVVPRLTARSPEEFYQLLCRTEVTVLNQTPSAFRQLISATEESGERHRLRYVIFGGEALEPTMLKPWYESQGDEEGAAPATQLVNMYGITETTVHVTYYPLEPADARRTGASPIGKRIPDLKMYLLDGQGQPAPLGVGGEIYVGGAGVARGYLNRPELTAERFLPDPFTGEPGARMYRAGDLARWRADGNQEFLGRNDFQVKIRGFRIELGEIETQLTEYPGVKQAVVTARDDGSGDRKLVAYYTGKETGPEALRSHLSSRLPDYMAPAVYVHLESLPLTENGKLDRKALPDPEEQAYLTRGYEPPINETETMLAAIWAELLGLERVGRHDNFFELGGHSLLVVRLLSRVRQTMGVEAPIADLFSRPVMADFALAIDSASRSKGLPVTPTRRDCPLELSFAQQRLWFLSQFEGASEAYHIAGGLRLLGSLDRIALRRALDRIVARHEVLRTTFSEVDGQPVQIIGPAETGFLLREHDMRFAPDRSVALERLAADEAGQPFDLEHGPLIRGRLAQLDHDDHALLVTMHHIVSDGWSMGILINELNALYRAYCEGGEAALPDLPIQYADYAAWQRQWLQGAVLGTQIDYWRRQLGGELPVLALPTDKTRPDQQTHRGAEVSLLLPATLLEPLKALSLNLNCTLFMTLLAAFDILIYYLTGQTDICVGTDVANRNRAEIEKLIGFFVNQLVLRAKLSPDSTFEELLREVRETTLGAYAHQDLPFEKLVETLNLKRDSNRHPLFQVKMVYQNARAEDPSLTGLRITPITRTIGAAKLDLLLDLTDVEQGLKATLQYNTDLFEEPTPQRIISRFQTLLDRIVERPWARLRELVEALISEDERQQIEQRDELENARLKKLTSVRRRAASKPNTKVNS